MFKVEVTYGSDPINQPTGRKVESKVFHLYRFRDGRIVDRWGP